MVARHTPSALLAANAPPSLCFVALDRQPWWASGGTEAAVAAGGAIEPALGQRMPPAVLDWVHCGIAAVVPCHRRPFHGYYVVGKIEGRLYGHLPHGQLSPASLLTTRHNVRCDLSSSSSSAPEALDFFLFILRARNLSPRTSQ